MLYPLARALMRPLSMRSWFIVTPEYPPSPGGVSDYTRTLARELAARGDRVDVWAPRPPDGDFLGEPSVTCHGLPDRFGRKSRRTLDEALRAIDRETILLVQYVPQGFGVRGMNLPFAVWLGRRKERLWLMVHEAVYPFQRGQPLRHHLLAGVTRAMLAAATARSERVFVSTPAWRPILERYALGSQPAEWLPVPATVPLASSPSAVDSIRHGLQLSPGQTLVGHFGSYGRLIADPLAECFERLNRARPDWKWLMLGRNSSQFARAMNRLSTNENVCARDDLAEHDVANHLSALDIVLLPFPDGISSRRTSAMAALAVGSAVVTTTGPSTEAIWHDSDSAVLVRCDPDELAAATLALANDRTRRTRLRARARALYAEHFDVAKVVERLQSLSVGRRP